ncbi:GNAT family N-acetyltransferase [Fulvivirga sediminis]|uniref:GNAT family N-acetyltransferase n=1 Tax=Fulvivirga sediminis TaxID=2803949 RepID=A0A937F2R1_9BACT|nr:GNAT family N-acetyltransferase [Fulvivirga sediminis]MBL3654650.1 GNAT family N-acetyltransferase [Fulvivirga sediminis]
MINIQRADTSHINIIIDYQKKMAWQTEELELDDDTLQKGVTAVFNDPTKGQYYVAIHNEEVIGCLLVTPEWSEWRNGTVLWIQSVYVSKDFRKQGVFKQMYNYLKAQVIADEKLMGLRLYVEKTNLPAQKVYEAIGMNGDHYQFFEWMKTF